MSSDNICELFLVRRLHFHTNAAPQKCRRKLTLLITGEYDKRESRTAYVSCFNNNWLILISTAIEHNSCLPGLLSHPSQLWNVVLPLLKDIEQIIWQVNIALIDFVNQQYTGIATGK